MDVLKPEIDEKVHNAVKNAVNNDRRINLYIYVQNGDMKIENAARNANLSTADFSKAMATAGYTVPQGTVG